MKSVGSVAAVVEVYHRLNWEFLRLAGLLA